MKLLTIGTKTKFIIKFLAGFLFVLFVHAAMANEKVLSDIQAEFYGSLRMQTEFVDADNQSGNFDDYTGIRDAFSRAGIKLTHNLNKNWAVLFHAEIPLDLANLKIQTSWNQDEDMRILKLQLIGTIGQFWYGQGWIAYYNHIAYPVDQFSSFYSGFATFSSLRLKDTFYYATPKWHGLKAAFSSSADNGNNGNRRNQYAASYQNHGVLLAGGIDDIGGSKNKKVIGLSASLTHGPWYIASKYERFNSDIAGSGWAANGADAANIMLQYSRGKHTWLIMFADVDNFGENTFHMGWSYQYHEDIKLFIEFYQEQETAVIADSLQTTYTGSNLDPADSGGKILLTGVRYDF